MGNEITAKTTVVTCVRPQSSAQCVEIDDRVEGTCGEDYSCDHVHVDVKGLAEIGSVPSCVDNKLPPLHVHVSDTVIDVSCRCAVEEKEVKDVTAHVSYGLTTQQR